MVTTITLAQFLADPAEVARLSALGYMIRVTRGDVLCFTVVPAGVTSPHSPPPEKT